MQLQDTFIQGLMHFLSVSPTPAHAVDSTRQALIKADFKQLDEAQTWALEPGKGYFVIRGGKSIIAWRQGLALPSRAGMRMLGAHTDSPCLKVKPQAELLRNGCLQLGVEVYGGVLLNPWFDRDLSLAGQVHYLNPEGQLCSALLDRKEPLAVIPSLAIHLNREANKGMAVNAQQHLPVVLRSAREEEDAQGVFRQLLADWVQEAGHPVSEVVDYELCFYDTQPPAVIGLEKEYLASARLDNLLSCYVGLQALLSSPAAEATALLVCNDHEEIGSATALGAEGPFLESLLRRLSGDEAAYQQMISRSLMISCDNAHALHPNFPDRHDENHGPKINAGPVIKINANQRYATSSETSALFAGFCRQAGVPCQRFVVRSDMGCGSTIGPITATRLGVRVVDVGVPQWAMHSIRETAGCKDVKYLKDALQVFWTADLAVN